jgi:hypothetical protein
MWGALADGNIWYLNPSGIWICYNPVIWVETSPGIIQPTCQKWIDKSLPPLQTNPYIPNPNFTFHPQLGFCYLPNIQYMNKNINYVDYDAYEIETPFVNSYQYYNHNHNQQYNYNFGYTGDYSGEYNGEYESTNQSVYTPNTQNTPNTPDTQNMNENPLTKTTVIAPSLTSIQELEDEDDFDYSDMPELVEAVEMTEYDGNINTDGNIEYTVKSKKKFISWVDDEDLSDNDVFE